MLPYTDFETMNINDVDKIVDGKNMKNSPSVWFTNLDHGRRHQPLSLMTMADNIKFSKHKFRLVFWINIALSSLKLSEQQKAKVKAYSVFRES